MSNMIALVSLDLGGRGSMCGTSAKESTPMDAHLVEATIKAYLTEIRNRLDKAVGIGRAADACAGAGFHEKGLEVALDVEQLLYEASALLNAASLITRIARQSLGSVPLGGPRSKRPPQRDCNSNRPYAGHDGKRATILLRIDWLTGLIGALLW